MSSQTNEFGSIESENSLENKRLEVAELKKHLEEKKLALQKAKESLKSKVDHRKELLLCSVCYLEYNFYLRPPVNFDCSHTICEPCMQRLIAISPVDDFKAIVSCTKCRHVSEIRLPYKHRKCSTNYAAYYLCMLTDPKP